MYPVPNLQHDTKRNKTKRNETKQTTTPASDPGLAQYLALRSPPTSTEPSRAKLNKNEQRISIT